MSDKIQPEAMFKFSYGLYVVSASSNGKDNGCIVNTAIQLTDIPKTVALAVNKANLTHDMIFEDGRFNLSFLSEKADFDLFKRFGFQSGRTADKFDGIETARSENGLIYLPNATNGFLSGKVTSKIDVGTHTLFIADVTEAKTLSDVPSVTYAYYFANIKPQPQVASQPNSPTQKKRWMCQICGYIYEGDELPADIVCPLCKHGADDFILLD